MYGGNERERRGAETIRWAELSRARLFALLTLFTAVQPGWTEAVKPIARHPDNPHYFLFRGKPAVLLTSGERYGAVVNLDFDYIPYLDELKARGFNLTRTFAGTYREVSGSFGITDNTLAPKAERFLAPWTRDGDKFDLKKWNPAYFERL